MVRWMSASRSRMTFCRSRSSPWMCPGSILSDKRIQTTNDELQKGLAQSVSDSNGEVRYTEATVTKDGLTLKMEVTASDQK